MSWDPTQYLAFADHRLRPVADLIAHVRVAAPKRIVDLGCGAGNATKLLRQTWPEARITGVDSSPAMLERARAELPDAEWIDADIGTWRPDAPVDLLFSNAALHWLGDHERLFARLASYVAPGGCLAVQMPANFDAPSHRLVDEAARAGPWHATLQPMLGQSPTRPGGFYYDVLSPVAAELDIWTIEYLQILSGENPVAEFTKGSWLKPFLDALEEPERSAFEATYRKLISTAYQKRSDGRTLFPFKRFFIVAKI